MDNILSETDKYLDKLKEYPIYSQISQSSNKLDIEYYWFLYWGSCCWI